MSERWRTPPKIEAVEHDPQNYTWVHGENDVPTLDAEITVDEETFTRMKEGYICAQCFEPHEIPFPRACSLCGFPMRDGQAERLELDYSGTKWLGPRMTIADELERLAEENERRKHSRIVLPPGVSGP